MQRPPADSPLLLADEPAACTVHRADGASSAFLTCDHASARIPALLGDLGLTEQVRLDHVGWDIGAARVARAASAALDATLVESGYSRLVIDANRPIEVASSIPEVTCGVTVPGNLGIGDGARAARDRALPALPRPREARVRHRHASGRAQGAHRS